MRTLTGLQAAVRDHPDDDQARRALGAAYADLKLPDAALASCEAARTLNPSAAGHWAASAELLAKVRRVDDARIYYEQALTLDPASPRLLAAFGKLLVEHGIDPADLARAEEMLSQAVMFDPRETGACGRLSRVLLSRMGPDEAIDHLETTLAGRVDPVSVRAAVAAALMDLGHYEPAYALYRASLERSPGSPESPESPANGALLTRLAEAEVCLGEMEAARRTHTRAVAASPRSGRGFVSYVEHLIRLDRLDEAMRVCRARAGSPLPFGVLRRVPRDSAHEDWRGTPLAGRTVMLRAEAGNGDAVQFARFASLFREAGARVVIETFPCLVPLFQTLDHVDLVVTPYEDTPPIDFDLHPAFGAMLLEWTWASMAARIPYLHPPASLVREKRRRLGGRTSVNAGMTAGMKVGVTWQGERLHQHDPHRRRSVPLADLAPLARVPGVTLHSLQFGAGADDVNTAAFPIVTPDVGDFLDTAATVEALDLIVTVDTAMAHLAGALGKRCFVLLPYRACWRWMLDDRDTSAFYPSLRLYRQTRPGDWTGAIAAVARDIEQLARADVRAGIQVAG